MDVERIIDFERHLSPDRRADVVAAGRRAITAEGCATFGDFVRPDALAAMLREAKQAMPDAHRRSALYTAYLATEARGDEMHPTRRQHRYALSAVAQDRLSEAGTLNALYYSDAFIRFVADILDEPELHPLADPMLGLTLTFLADGDEHGWHFDRNDFVVSLLLQAPEGGGAFEFAPFVRAEDEPNFDAVASIMDGDASRLRRVPLQAGMLSIFEGRRSLHRVSPVRGETTRIVALLSYDRVPNLVYEEEVHLRTFGRIPLRA